MNSADYYEDVSLKLTEVLDASGLKNDLRWRRINTWMQIEELERILIETLAGPDARQYFFGSQAEATTTHELASDIDRVFFISGCEVLQDFQFWEPSLHMKRTFLMVTDESTPPGYVKLHLVQRDAPMTVHNYQDKFVVLDSEGRSVLSNGVLFGSFSSLVGNRLQHLEIHGPAITSSLVGTSADLLLSWVQCAKCPNYFMPDENMFLGKLEGRAQRQIVSILQDLLRQNGRYITKIPYENIGENVIRVCQSFHMELYCPEENILIQTICHIVSALHFFCLNCGIYHLSNVRLFRSRHGSRQEISNIVHSIFFSFLGTHLASQSLKQERYNQEDLIAAQELLLLGSSSDVAVGKLKLAAFYLAQGKVNTMEEVLNQVDANFTHTVCEQGDIRLKQSTLSKILHEDLSTGKFIQNCLALSVCYSPSDIHCVPKVLIFEIFRSTGSEQSFDMITSVILNMPIVRARVYLYFLQYQCFHRQGQVTHRLVALNNMIWEFTDYYQKLLDIMENTTVNFGRRYFLSEMIEWLGYGTTSLNLMAYCMKQDGRPRDAFKVLYLSMKLKNQHNAAKWQIATYVNSSMRI
ncbi:hypothetical protein CHS0354_006774 [Potamilus streckersoni]|uniref:Uncharacterized protein n=1 Tax=Potamilus streckersoni TaxID=2493646 RepID=A0AAE0VS56_9BIVA|nr:hypothetical protein CHS0354_006774 [Potamilus streckersoni]